MSTELKTKRTSLPKHAQIRHQLQSLIKSEGYENGDPFFTEKQICEQFGVSMITAKRVLDDLRQLGFVERRRGAGTFICGNNPDDSAAATPAAQSLGILLHDAVNAFIPAMVEIIKGVGQKAKESGYDLKILVSSSGPVTRTVEDAKVNGLFVAYSEVTDEELVRLQSRHTALLAFSRGSHLAGIHTIGGNELLTMLLIGEHLAQLGHRRVAFFHGPREFEFTRRYLEGFQLVTDRFNFDADERLMVETGRSGMERGDKGFVPTEEELESLRQMIVSPQRPTAFILPTWNMSVRLLDMARSLNLQVPQDVSIVSMAGPSDEESSAAQLPRITRVYLDNRETGRRAAEILLNLIAGHACPKVTSLKTQLLVQDTTGPASGI